MCFEFKAIIKSPQGSKVYSMIRIEGFGAFQGIRGHLTPENFENGASQIG